MRFRLLFSTLLVAAQFSAQAQAADLHAVTEDGQRVILSSDGKWHIDKHAASSVPSLSQSPYHTAVSSYTVAFDATQWIPAEKSGNDTEPTKKMFRHKSLPIYGMVIADEIAMTTDSLRNIIITNADKAADTKTTVVLDETEDVKGKTIGSIRFIATKEKVDFLFATHYYASPAGNIQVVCFTSQSLFTKYAEDCKKFISGLTVE